MSGLTKKNLWFGIVLVLVAGLLLGFLAHSLMSPKEEETAKEISFEDKSMEEKREEWILEGMAIKNELSEKGEYSCCLENPCWYCIYKTPGHGEGATCECAQDILAGEHPCGECIGEILEGHGEQYLAPYFAKAISQKVGEQHLEHLKLIIADMYNISVEDQV